MTQLNLCPLLAVMRTVRSPLDLLLGTTGIGGAAASRPITYLMSRASVAAWGMNVDADLRATGVSCVLVPASSNALL